MDGNASVAVVTGANSGIALEATKSLLALGYRVAALDVKTDTLEVLPNTAGNLLVQQCDVRSDRDVALAIDAAVQKWGRIDVLVNNAAVAPFGRFEETPLDSIRNTFEVNVFGYVRTIAAVLPIMRAQGRGTIVNVVSMLAFVGLPSLPAYASSKGAVEGLSRCLALDLATEGIRVKLFHPPSTRTPAARALCLPAYLTGDPVKVGAALAASVSSRRRVVTADFRTTGLLVLTRVTPGLFGELLTRLVRFCQRTARTNSSVSGSLYGSDVLPKPSRSSATAASR